MIIVGTDFSNTALVALQQACLLATRLRSGCAAVHVRQPYAHGVWEPDEDQRLWLESARLGESDVELGRGTPWVELIRIARERHAELIVVGTHGRSGFQPLVLGSTAQRLSLLSPIPTLLVGSRWVEHATPAQRWDAQMEPPRSWESRDGD